MFGKNLYQSLHFGKGGKGDFTEKDLPKNRLQLFFTMLKLRFGGIAVLNMFYMIAAIPTVAWTALNMKVIIEIGDEYVHGSVTLWLLWLVPCLLLLGPALAGVTAVLRNFARDQHAYTVSDFFENAKKNWKQALGVQIIDGVMLLVAWFGYITYGELAQNNASFYRILQVVSVGVPVFWYLMGAFIYPLMVTYKLTFKELLKNAAVLTLAKLPVCIVLGILPLILPASALFVADEIYLGVVMLVYIAVMFGLVFFLRASYTNAVFDKVINPHIAGARVNMGLREAFVEDEQDDDDDDDDEGIIGDIRVPVGKGDKSKKKKKRD